MRTQQRSLLILGVLSSIVVVFLYNRQLTAERGNLSSEKNMLIDENTFQKAIQKGKSFHVDRSHLIFLHIQKTSGSHWAQAFPTRLLELDDNGQWIKACDTKTKNCGDWHLEEHEKVQHCKINNPIGDLHPRFPLLKECALKGFPHLQNRTRIFYTLLRDPVQRFISEWAMLNRLYAIDKRKGIRTDYDPECIANATDQFLNRNAPMNLTLEEYADSKWNYGFNRQVKFLLDETYPICDSVRKWGEPANNAEMIRQAKKTLNDMPFFGLAEYQYLSQKLFEASIGQDQFKFDYWYDDRKTKASEVQMDPDVLRKIEQGNWLDIELYDYAKKLFFKKVNYFNLKDLKQ